MEKGCNSNFVDDINGAFGPGPTINEMAYYVTNEKQITPERLDEMRNGLMNYNVWNDGSNQRIPVRRRLSIRTPVPFEMHLVPLLPPFDTAVRSVTPLPVLIIL
jgi:hypothetical protein